MTSLGGRVPTSATVSHVIIRACSRCGHKREQGKPCEGCGNDQPPVVHDLGVQSATYRDPLRRWWWRLAGQYAARHRLKAATRHVKD